MRRNEDNKWMHSACAFWHPEIKFLEQNVFNAARSLRHVRADRKTKQLRSQSLISSLHRICFWAFI